MIPIICEYCQKPLIVMPDFSSPSYKNLACDIDKSKKCPSTKNNHYNFIITSDIDQSIVGWGKAVQHLNKEYYLRSTKIRNHTYPNEYSPFISTEIEHDKSCGDVSYDCLLVIESFFPYPEDQSKLQALFVRLFNLITFS